MFLKIVSSAYVDLALLLSNTNVIPTEKSIYINEKGELMARETSKPSVNLTVLKSGQMRSLYIAVFIHQPTLIQFKVYSNICMMLDWER